MLGSGLDTGRSMASNPLMSKTWSVISSQYLLAGKYQPVASSAKEDLHSLRQYVSYTQPPDSLTPVGLVSTPWSYLVPGCCGRLRFQTDSC